MFCRKCGTENVDGANYCKVCGDNLIGGELKSESAEFANPWKRLAAAIIDGLILMAISIPFHMLLEIPGSGMVDMSEMFNTSKINNLNLIMIIVRWLYFAIQESSEKQATVGKRAMGIVIGDKDGNRISFARATGRHFAKILSVITCYIGFLIIFFTEKKQGLHDLVASTYAYEKNK